MSQDKQRAEEAKRKVLAVWPGADMGFSISEGRCVVWGGPNEEKRIGTGRYPDAAWIDAASRLPVEGETPSAPPVSGMVEAMSYASEYAGTTYEQALAIACALSHKGLEFRKSVPTYKAFTSKESEAFRAVKEALLPIVQFATSDGWEEATTGRQILLKNAVQALVLAYNTPAPAPQGEDEMELHKQAVWVRDHISAFGKSSNFPVVVSRLSRALGGAR